MKIEFFSASLIDHNTPFSQGVVALITSDTYLGIAIAVLCLIGLIALIHLVRHSKRRRFRRHRWR